MLLRTEPQLRIGQYSPKATHLIKVTCQTALKQRPAISIFGTDFPHTRWNGC